MSVLFCDRPLIFSRGWPGSQSPDWTQPLLILLLLPADSCKYRCVPPWLTGKSYQGMVFVIILICGWRVVVVFGIILTFRAIFSVIPVILEYWIISPKRPSRCSLGSLDVIQSPTCPPVSQHNTSGFFSVQPYYFCAVKYLHFTVNTCMEISLPFCVCRYFRANLL